VKSSGRDESIRVIRYMFMEAMLGISLYIYLYLKLAKMLCLSYYCLCLLFNITGEEGEQVLPGSKRGRGRGRGQSTGRRDGPNNVCTYEKIIKSLKVLSNKVNIGGD
jgi:hypothetical protein